MHNETIHDNSCREGMQLLNTVKDKYSPTAEDTHPRFAKEKPLEEALIEQLKNQGYEEITSVSKEFFYSNLREQIEKLNKFKFTDGDWEKIYDKHIKLSSNVSSGYADLIKERSEFIHNKDKNTISDWFTRSDGTKEYKTIIFFDRKNILNNHVQVCQQVTNKREKSSSRYDVCILVNGFPLVLIELKRYTEDIEEALKQCFGYAKKSIDYGTDSDDDRNISGLFQFVQMFIISNEDKTKYYANSLRVNKLVSDGQNLESRGVLLPNDLKFANYWTDKENTPIKNLFHFTEHFLAKENLLRVLLWYSVFNNANKQMMIMRPYQIAATEAILNRIALSIAYPDEFKLDTNKSGGYIWHSTGSGKTLTSFKTCQLITDLDFEQFMNHELSQGKTTHIDKVLFVVDRLDLDDQTNLEYKKFLGKNDNTLDLNTDRTEDLKKQLLEDKTSIIITTIHKLNRLLSSNETLIDANGNNILDSKRFVLIFDECHRSQYGDMNKRIREKLRNKNIFGFTGTPIFNINKQKSSLSKKAKNLETQNSNTTEELFGERLHQYTLKSAIEDGNVLPLLVEFQRCFNLDNKKKENFIELAKKNEHNPEFWDDMRILAIANHIFKNFAHKTLTNASAVNYYTSTSINSEGTTQNPAYKANGFNSIFATSSFADLRKYYYAFKALNDERPDGEKLKIATIFSIDAKEGDIVAEEFTFASETTDNGDNSGTEVRQDSTTTAVTATDKPQSSSDSIKPSVLHHTVLTNIDPEKDFAETESDSEQGKTVIKINFASNEDDADYAIHELVYNQALDQSISVSGGKNFNTFDVGIDELPRLLENIDLNSFSQTEDKKKFFLEVVKDYNQTFNKNYDSSRYNEDLRSRLNADIANNMKNRQIDILIVVDMYLTGFDAKSVNTLWVDKNLKLHNLVQAFSRTNRIYNHNKTNGNIVCFRDLVANTKEAYGVFGIDFDDRAILILDYDSFVKGYTDDEGNKVLGYEDQILKLISEFGDLKDAVKQLSKEESIDFINQIQKILNMDCDLRSYQQYYNDSKLMLKILRALEKNTDCVKDEDVKKLENYLKEGGNLSDLEAQFQKNRYPSEQEKNCFHKVFNWKFDLLGQRSNILKNSKNKEYIKQNVKEKLSPQAQDTLEIDVHTLTELALELAAQGKTSEEIKKRIEDVSNINPEIKQKPVDNIINVVENLDKVEDLRIKLDASKKAAIEEASDLIEEKYKVQYERLGKSFNRKEFTRILETFVKTDRINLDGTTLTNLIQFEPTISPKHELNRLSIENFVIETIVNLAEDNDFSTYFQDK